MCHHPYGCYCRPPRRYGFWKFMLDVFMLALTHGFWLIWIIIRETRR